MSEAAAIDPFELVFSSASAASPHAAYERLRGQCPVARGEFVAGPAVFVSRYEDVLWALRHPDVFSSAEDAIDMGQPVPLLPLQVDPPAHTRYRRLLNPRFVPRAVGEMEPAVRERATALVDAVAARGECDFHADVATPLPSQLFLRLVGLPEDDLPQFLVWRDQTVRPGGPDPEQARHEASRAIHAYFVRAIAELRAAGDAGSAAGLLAQLATAELDGERLTDDELLGICHLLLLGGLDTVTASLDCMIVYLARRPDLRAALVADPSRWPAAIEELLRHQTPVQVVPRVVASDVELGGVQLRAGDRVTLVLGAANADEAAWSGPGDVDLDRDAARHLAFGGGNHLCLGAHLARLELRVALEAWHARVPDYALPDGFAPVFSPGIRQVETLPLHW